MEIWIFQKINQKPSIRKKIITLSKPERKINELWPYLKKQIEEKIKYFGFVR